MFLPLQRMQEYGHAVPQIDISHMKSTAYNSQHCIWTLRLHTTHMLLLAQDKSGPLKMNH